MAWQVPIDGWSGLLAGTVSTLPRQVTD